jgi:hypothetical protein
MTLQAPFPSWPRGEHRGVAEAVTVGLLVALMHVLFRLSAGFLVGVLNDDGVYVALGKAIADGAGYRSIHLVGAPLQVRYPPGLPLLLAVPWALGGTLAAVRATVAALHPVVAGGAAGLVWWMGRRRLQLPAWPLAICAIGPFLLDPVIQYFNIALTEPYLVFGWAGALVLAAPLRSPSALAPPPAEPSGGPARPGRAVALGLILAATTLFRTAGIALIPGVLLALAVHRRWREAAACAAALLAPLLLWEALQGYWMSRGPVSSQPDDLSYVRWLGAEAPAAFAGFAARAAATNVVEYVRKLAGYLFASQRVGIAVVLTAALAAGVACVRLWRSQTTLVLTTVFAVALTLTWPYAQGRLLLPLLPFLGLLAASTWVAVDRWVRPPLATPLRWGLQAALGLAAIAVTLRQVELREAAGRSFQSGVLPAPQDFTPTLTLAVRSRFIYRVAQWVRAHTAPGDRIMVDAPAAVYLYTGRRTVAALPTERRLGSSTFDVPGRYLAERILVDSVTFLLWLPPGSGLENDLRTIQARCPRVLRPEAYDCPGCFRIDRDEGCLRRQVLAGGSPP